MDLLWNWSLQTWLVVLEAAPWLVVGFVLAGVISVLLPTGRVVGHLGKPGWGSVFKAAVVGVPLPLCSCSVIPIASTLRRQGASKGATGSFLISTPESGVDSIALTWALMGPWWAIVRPIAAFITAMTAGGLMSLGEKDDAVKSAPQPAAEEGGCCCHAQAAATPAPERPTMRTQAQAALRYGLIDMIVDLGHWLVIGFILAGLVAALVPADFFEGAIGTGFLPMLVMLFAGLPLYICATGATPLVAALIAKGLSPGAALVLLLVGPATNLATMVVVGRELGRRALVIYIAAIAVLALVLGMVLELLPASLLAVPAGAMSGHAMTHGFWHWASAIILTLMLLNGLRINLVRWISSSRHPADQEAPAAPQCHRDDAESGRPSLPVR
jgi:uncharacterized membrane protein YraQ (UPF0718 family)